MRPIVLFFIFLFIISCSKKIEGVYWCGDNPCKNNAERDLYFKENLIIEVKSDKKIAKKINNKSFLKRKLFKKKSKVLKVKKNKKKKVIKNKKIKIKKVEDNNKTKNIDLSELDDFEKITEIIINRNKNKPYPDVNSFPE